MGNRDRNQHGNEGCKPIPVPGLPGRGPRAKDGDYIPIPLASLRLDRETGFNLYLRAANQRHMVLYRSGDLKFGEEHRERLNQNCVEEVFIAGDDRRNYSRYMEGHLTQVLKDESIPAHQRAKILYSSASVLMEDVFQNPALGANIARAHDFVDTTVAHLARKAEHFSDLLNIMSFDYYTYTHSVNVCVFGVSLGRRLGYGQTELNHLGAGLLLHDAGKSVIDPSILSKKEQLTDEEWAIIKTHPARGVEILQMSGAIEESALFVVGQHHEKCTGEGYPQGLRGDQIHPYAKIGMVADIFDALTTQRVYKNALSSFPALKIMQQELKGCAHAKLLQELVYMLHERKGSANPKEGFDQDAA